MDSPPPPEQIVEMPRKRLIICCDGTWMNSDDGYQKSTLQIPSNVTRISRAFRRQCNDSTLQIIYYQNGVGSSSSSSMDRIFGGAFGRGIAENIREVYSFICSNYCDGDEIVLLGFSRGAFTARSVAGLIGGIGLLTRLGMEFFYPILKDVENWKVEGYERHDKFPEYPPLHGGKPCFGTLDTGDEYRTRLLEGKLTRTSTRKGQIKVRAVGVWDTVGSLGIPDIPWLNALGLPQSTKEHNFYDTELSCKIEYAFQALALDENRPPFQPTVWERPASQRKGKDGCEETVLKQVWFPGNHGNIGGGWGDQQMADITLAWMADQLSAVGVEFKVDEMVHLFRLGREYYLPPSTTPSISDPAAEVLTADHDNPNLAYHNASSSAASSTSDVPHIRDHSPFHSNHLPDHTHPHNPYIPKPTPSSFLSTIISPFHASSSSSAATPWANPPIYTPTRPRPWALGQICTATSLLFRLTGFVDRKPGLYLRVDPETDKERPGEYLERTGEMVHPSVRTRLGCGGLGLNDKEVWAPKSLRGWRLERERDLVSNASAGIIASASGVVGGRRRGGGGVEERGRTLGVPQDSGKAWSSASGRRESGYASASPSASSHSDVHDHDHDHEADAGAGGLAERVTLPLPRWPSPHEKAVTGVAEIEYHIPACENADRWVWVYTGSDGEDFEYGSGDVNTAKKIMPEETMGFWERVLMGITVGLPEIDVYKVGEEHAPVWWPEERGSMVTRTMGMPGRYRDFEDDSD